MTEIASYKLNAYSGATTTTEKPEVAFYFHRNGFLLTLCFLRTESAL